MDVGADGPDAAMNGFHRGQPRGHGEPEEVQVELEGTAPAVPEDAEHEAVPGLGMDGAVEEGAAFESDRFGPWNALEDHRQRVVARRVGDGCVDRIGGFGGAEPHGSAGRMRRGVVVADLGVALAGEVFRLKVHRPAAPGMAAGRARP